MGKDLLNYLNKKDYFSPTKYFEVTKTGLKKIESAGVLDDQSLYMDLILSRMMHLHPEQLATEEKLYYWNVFGNFEKKDFRSLAMVAWTHDNLQEKYAAKYINDLEVNFGSIKCFAQLQKNGMTYPVASKINYSVGNLFRQVFNLKLAKNNDLEYEGKHYAAFGTVGKLLTKTAIIGLYPLEKINSSIRGLRIRLIIFALLSLSLTLAIGKILAAKFLEPIKYLGTGVKAIGEQNYRYRLPINSEDEFGHLNSIFNRAIESLEDLAVAKIVQENLFPPASLKASSLEVYGKSVSMTRLGGDYFDFFKIDDTQTGILMGDVAGHGVPAALLMAMAKASVLMAEEQKLDPAAMMVYLHKVIHSVKSKTIKRMMTCQYFNINSMTGDFTFANAGHCFPIILRENGQRTEFIKLIGTPLGILKRAKYKNDTAKLEPNDIMVLYTDGIIESANEKGQEIGFEGFCQALIDNYNSDLKVFYKGIFDFYLDWTSKADDDITFVLVKLNQEENHEG